MRKKSDLPTKICPICERPFTWRSFLWRWTKRLLLLVMLAFGVCTWWVFPRYITDIDALRSAIGDCTASLGDIGVLLNNVANDDRHAFEEIEQYYFDWEVSINLRPHVFAAQAVIDGMKRLGGGSIINLGSIGWMRKNDATVLYGALNSSMHGLTKGLARRVGSQRIRVNTLVPG